MAEPSADHMLDMDKRLAELSPIPSERCIFRVYDPLRNENKKAYESEVVAIGPYHHGNNLQPMEERKLRYLKQLLNRRNEGSAEIYIEAMRESEQTAREFYAEPIRLDLNEFVETMLLDSCFTVELLRGPEMPNDPLVENALIRDLMLFENQLPFFIVKKLFDMTKSSADSLEDLIRMFIRFFSWWIIGCMTPVHNLVAPSVIPREDDIKGAPFENPREDDINHLLGLLHYCCCYQFHSMVSKRDPVEKKDKSLNSATELQEAGIKFNKTEGRNLFDIRFVNGTMEIPTLEVDDYTESFFRNLIAYEQYLPYTNTTSRNHFTAYRKFMDYLVNTSKDVEILTHRGIIFNLLGDNEVVAAMINKLSNNIIVSDVGYEEVYNKVNEHCRGKWNFWLAILRRKYFNNPWALISFLAAVVLLLLTVLQTILPIHPVGKSN
ncbi:UPF0481 protein At3g47200-like [Camellia sinensis]|uniref:Uncharacterized protein n=1 Tax=Camellia sinensis var. sinensis TaxID=542762 RepID=A0A4S4DDH0_CAMSN|nr:UPF0481 protein At3g47200-like [Camellia sinensis]THG00635.1 hypothetical protein TEA_011638 [Camellia sinensis var. sinensis]